MCGSIQRHVVWVRLVFLACFPMSRVSLLPLSSRMSSDRHLVSILFLHWKGVVKGEDCARQCVSLVSDCL